MRVIDVSRRPIAAGWGRCRAVRLLHFAAAPMADCLTLKRQAGLPGKSRTRVRSVVVGCGNGPVRAARLAGACAAAWH
jgi:hypothetical protein